MKFVFPFACLFLSSSLSIFCQDSPYHQAYFENLKQELSRNENITEIKYYQKKYFNGNLKDQEMHVKYANDTINRYWIIGKAYTYFKNGNVKVYESFDLENKVPVDTGYGCYKNGNIKFITVFQNDSAFTQYPEKIRFKNIWYANSARWNVIEFNKGGMKKVEIPWTFVNYKSQLDGNFILYDSKGNKVEIDEYKNNKIVKKTRVIAELMPEIRKNIPRFNTDSTQLAGCIEIIEKDSLKFYIKSTGVLVDKNCADYYRLARMNHDAYVFNGTSFDYYISGKIEVEAYYVNNLLSGNYNSYYENGQIKESGEFSNGQKTGIWNFWFDNGQLKKVILYENDDYYIQESFKYNGRQLIKNGNGKFIEKDLLSESTIKGRVKNGKQNGKWTIFNHLSNSNTTIEKFNNGELIIGQNNALVPPFKEKYTDKQRTVFDVFTDNLYSNYSGKIQCIKLGSSYNIKSYNSEMGFKAFYDYIYQNFDPGTLNKGYLLVGFSIDVNGEITKINSYSTIENPVITDELLRIISCCEKWGPEKFNGNPVESSELIVFQFFENGYKILNDLRNSYPLPMDNLDRGAKFQFGKDSLFSRVLSNLNLPAEFCSDNFNLGACLEFHVNELGNLIEDDGNYLNRLRVTENEKALYNSLRNALLESSPWQPATLNNVPLNHYFIAVLSIKNGKPIFRLFSRNWMID